MPFVSEAASDFTIREEASTSRAKRARSSSRRGKCTRVRPLALRGLHKSAQPRSPGKRSAPGALLGVAPSPGAAVGLTRATLERGINAEQAWTQERQDGAVSTQSGPGWDLFFTVTLRDRRNDALVRHVDALRQSWRSAKSRVPHAVMASVVLPDHLHAVIEMCDGGDYSRLWQEIKKGFTRRTQRAADEHRRGNRDSGNTPFAMTPIFGRISIMCISIR